MAHRGTSTNRKTIANRFVPYNEMFWREISEGQWEVLIFVGEVQFLKVPFTEAQKQGIIADGGFNLLAEKIPNSKFGSQKVRRSSIDRLK